MRRAIRPRVGWRIYSMIVCMGAIMYFQQKGVMIAAERIMPELSVSQMQIGWIQWAYLLAYTPGQILAGRLGQRFGARATLTVAGLVAVLATIATPLAPLVLTGQAIFVGLFLSQLFLGFAQAPTFPIAAGILRTWLPARRWAFANGFESTGVQLGAAAAPAVLVFLMQIFGWQRALFWTALPPLGLVAVWAWYMRDTPREHASVSPEELADLEPQTTLPPQREAIPMLHPRLSVRDLALLTVSYTSMNYVFYLLGSWSFLYLIQERHFTVAQSGVLAALPPLAAALGAGVGGGLTDLLCMRLGLRWGYRLVPLISLSSVAVLLLLAVYVAGPVLAVVAMTLSYGMLELNEGAYWAATTQIAGANTMTAGGILNTGGSLGGLIGIPIVAFLSGHGQWHLAFLIGAACALMSAMSWLAIDAARGEPFELAGHYPGAPAELSAIGKFGGRSNY